MVKNLPASAGDMSSIQEDPLKEGMITYSSILTWEIPWSKEPDGLQPMGSQNRHYLDTKNNNSKDLK